MNKKIIKFKILEIFIIIAILFNYIMTNNYHKFEYVNSAKDLNANALNNIVNINKKILKEIIKNEGDIRNINNVSNSAFIGIRIFV